MSSFSFPGEKSRKKEPRRAVLPVPWEDSEVPSHLLLRSANPTASSAPPFLPALRPAASSSPVIRSLGYVHLVRTRGNLRSHLCSFLEWGFALQMGFVSHSGFSYTQKGFSLGIAAMRTGMKDACIQLRRQSPLLPYKAPLLPPRSKT